MNDALQRVFSEADYVVAHGSVGTVLTLAVLFRNWPSGRDFPRMVFTRRRVFTKPLEIEAKDLKQWSPGKVLIVGISAIAGESATTEAIVREMGDCGHKLIGIFDVHNLKAWRRAVEGAGADFEGLAIKPKSSSNSGNFSMALLLLGLLGEQADGHTRALCQSAHKASKSGPFQGEGLDVMVNAAIKGGGIEDDEIRRVLVQHFAFHDDCTGHYGNRVSKWIAAYEPIDQANRKVIKGAEDLGRGLVRIRVVGHKVDMPALFAALYGFWDIVLVEREYFLRNSESRTQVMFRRRHGYLPELDLCRVLDKNGISHSPYDGSTGVQVWKRHEKVALEAILCRMDELGA